MAYSLKHPPDLLVPALMQRHFIPGIFAALQKPDSRRRQTFIVNVRSASKPLEIAFRWMAGNFHVIDLRYDSGFGHELRELAVVGENNQSFGTEIQASDRINSLLDFALYIIENRWTILRIDRSRHHVFGLV